MRPSAPVCNHTSPAAHGLQYVNRRGKESGKLRCLPIAGLVLHIGSGHVNHLVKRRGQRVVGDFNCVGNQHGGQV